LGVPPVVLELQQKGLLAREFYDGLFPNLAYRAEAIAEQWPANTGNEIVMSRAGLLAPIVRPNTPGNDPLPQAIPFEQWTAELFQFTGSVDVDMPTSVSANASLFLRDIHQLGLQAGQSINRIARNAVFKAYLSGSTVANGAILTTDLVVRVAALNGFRDVVNPGVNARPQPVSTAFPLPIKVGTGATVVSASVVGVLPDDPTDPDGPGTLTLAVAIGTAFAVRAPVKSAYAPRIVRAAGGDSVDAVGSGDTFVLQQAINATAFLRRANVQPHEDGFYHAHISPLANAQVFADPVFQRLNQSLPEHVIYKEGFIGTLSGVMFFMNNESPEITNVGSLVATAAATGAPAGTTGVYASEIGAEIQNGNGVQIGRIILTGKGALYERWLDEGAYSTEAGTTGKIGEFTVVNNGITILTERIRLILRAPLDRLQQKIACTWSVSTSFPVPSDITAQSGPERFKRAVVLEFAM
jgi:hypothetical protein